VLVRPRRHAETSVVRLEVIVEDAELPDHAAAFIGKDRVGDAVRVGEGLQVGLAVIADRTQGIAGALELRVYALQLDQLRLAVRSPTCAADEHDDRAAAALVQTHQLAVLIGQDDIREQLPDLWAALTVHRFSRHVAH
jgi:hypothetical protein